MCHTAAPPIVTNSLHASVSPGNTGTPHRYAHAQVYVAGLNEDAFAIGSTGVVIPAPLDGGSNVWIAKWCVRTAAAPWCPRARPVYGGLLAHKRRAVGGGLTLGAPPGTSAPRLACSTSAPRPCPERLASAFGFWVARCEVRGIDRHRPDGEQPNDTWESPKSSIVHWAKPGGHQKEVGACARVRTDRYAHFRRLRE